MDSETVIELARILEEQSETDTRRGFETKFAAQNLTLVWPKTNGNDSRWGLIFKLQAANKGKEKEALEDIELEMMQNFRLLKLFV